MDFPIDLNSFVPVPLDLSQPQLKPDQLKKLSENIQLCRDAIVLMTAMSEAKGLGAHTGGAYDIVPELLIADGFMRGGDQLVPIYFDEAGHRVAIQYVMSVLNGHMDAERLCRHREYDAKLPGHPERDFTPGVQFSSGRLGHMWPYLNGVAMANPSRSVIMFGSDGAQQEGNDAEAARLAVAQKLNIKLLIDDNDVTIVGHPSQYLKGYDVVQTLKGHGLAVDVGDGEDIPSLYTRMQKALSTPGPVALINRRKMAPGIDGIEGTPNGHDAIKVDVAVDYLSKRGLKDAVSALQSVVKPKVTTQYLGSTQDKAKNRSLFGTYICQQLKQIPAETLPDKVRVFDNDLEGSCGLKSIREAYPDIFVRSGIMERGNFSAAAGFGMEPGRQGIYGTFSAFLEMLISEITMARLNKANVLAHFSHAGIDEMVDNTTHYGINNFFCHNGLAEEDTTRLYFPADQHQLKAIIQKVFSDAGLRFIFSTRAAVPDILKEDGTLFFDEGYQFETGKDDVVREGSKGYIVSYGEMLYRCLHVVDSLRQAGMDIGLINKPTLNVMDSNTLDKVGKSDFVLVVESQNQNTGLGIRFGTFLLESGYSPKYAHIGTWRGGNGGLNEQLPHQGLDPDSIKAKVQSLASGK